MINYNNIKISTQATAQELMICFADPNPELVLELMQFDASQLSELTMSKLSQYILVMGQYLVMLQYKENVKEIEWMLSKKALSHAYASHAFTYKEELKPYTTNKAKDAYLYTKFEDIQNLEAKALEAEAQRMVISSMTKACTELTNALKKEVSARAEDR